MVTVGGDHLSLAPAHQQPVPSQQVEECIAPHVDGVLLKKIMEPQEQFSAAQPLHDFPFFYYLPDNKLLLKGLDLALLFELVKCLPAMTKQ
jgi:hypothetical protein